MGYYVRVLSPRVEPIPLEALAHVVRTHQLRVDVEAETSGRGGLEAATLSLHHGAPIVHVEREDVEAHSLGESEVGELLEGLLRARPRSAVDWLRAYLPRVRTVYSMQFLGGSECDEGEEAVQALLELVHQEAGGIIQADEEGFSNEAGDHILWQFADDVSGPWTMAVRDGEAWVRFEMELGDPAQRAAFFEGRVPEGAKRS